MTHFYNNITIYLLRRNNFCSGSFERRTRLVKVENTAGPGVSEYNYQIK